MKVSLITWVNKPAVYEMYTAPAFVEGEQVGGYEIERVWVGPNEAGITNIGQAYNQGRERASGDMLVYIHQDVLIDDRSFLAQCDALLRRQSVGLVGVLGSTIDTGGGYWHAPMPYQRGLSPDLTRHPYGDYRVALLDGVVVATTQRIPWAECYEGPHMAIEDYCMRVRAHRGGVCWVGHIPAQHQGSSTLDDSYFRSMETFRAKWKPQLKQARPAIPSVERYRRYLAKTAGAAGEGMSNEEWIERGAWGPCWDITPRSKSSIGKQGNNKVNRVKQ